MDLLKKFKNTLLTLRFSILSIFVTLFITAIVILITINYNRYSNAMIYIATNLMEQAASDLNNELTTELAFVKTDNETVAHLIQENDLNPDNIVKTSEFIAYINSKLSIVQQAYWCDEKGDCINSLHEPNGTVTIDLIFNTTNPPYREYWYRDPEGNIIKKSKQFQFDYDPRTRPWYNEAKQARKTIWTNVYPLKEQPFLAFTVATPIYKKDGTLRGVFGMDIRLDWLSAYMKKLQVSPNSIIFIVNNKGNLIALPEVYLKEKQILELINIHNISKPWLAKAFDIFKKTNMNFFIFNFEGKTYLANYLVPTKEITLDWVIGVVSPQDDFTEELRKASLMDIYIGFVILLLGIAFVSTFITQVVRPIKKLVSETEKIKRFNLDEEERVQSRIKEVMLLSDAIHSMTAGLKSFRRYVPASLVRQLIEAGEDVHTGGTKKNLVILFSDIQNFTTIAEHMDPSELLDLMSVYFEELSQIIVSEKGTIDKYIGDSIMAFWGAPLPIENPCHAAARSALRCMDKLRKLNENWEKQGKPQLITRIGLHMGTVIVGNVGSSERLNYTALGDPINVASRLEGLNKVYGTSIIVSEEVYQVIKNDFILRKIDYVAVKGKTQKGYIYELVGEKGAP